MPWIYDGAWQLVTYPNNGTGGTGWGVLQVLRATKDRWYPLVGSGTLWIVRNAGVTTLPVSTDRHTGFLRFHDSEGVVAPGCRNGAIQTIFRVASASGSGRHQCGMVCICTHEDVHQSGTAYGLMLDGLQASSTWETLRLVKYPGPNGLRDDPETLQSIAFTVTRTTPVFLQLRWDLAIATDGLSLWGAVGTALNGSDLTDVLSVLVLPSLIVTNMTQGLAVVFSTASLSDGALDLRLESTEITGRYIQGG